MSFLVCRAYLKLIQFDLYLAKGRFQTLYEKVQRHPVRETTISADPVAEVCASIDIACVWYWKQVLCLQRSAATACLLKQFGVPAKLLLGVQHLPFKAHAWVEVNGQVVNEKPYMREMYSVLDRC